MSKLLVLSAAAALFAAVANAQSAPDWNLIPKACADQCAQTIEASYLCNQQYSIGTLVYGCFCSNFPSDAAGCATCLQSNNAAALATLLSGTTDDCKSQEKSCAFQCAFDTCQSSDVACQCDAGYLANIFNCATCNTANGNTGQTQISDFNSLKESCANQNFTGASQDFTTWVPSATGQSGYTAPVLTATGGGEAATGTFSAATDRAAATATAGAAATSGAASAAGAASAPGASAAGATPAANGSAAPTASGVAPTAAAGASGASGASAAPAASPSPSATGGAMAAAVPVGAAAAVALVAALL